MYVGTEYSVIKGIFFHIFLSQECRLDRKPGEAGLHAPGPASGRQEKVGATRLRAPEPRPLSTKIDDLMPILTEYRGEWFSDESMVPRLGPSCWALGRACDKPEEAREKFKVCLSWAGEKGGR